MPITSIVTDETMRELRMHGSAGFPFAYYEDDFHQYDEHDINWHWHREWEWLFVESGEVDCLIGSERIRLAAGDGMFIGSKVIHRFLSETDAKMPNILFLPELLAPQGSDLYEAYLLPVLQSGCSYLCFRPEQKPKAQILQDLCAVFRLAKMQSPDKLELFLAIFTLWQDFFQSMEPAFRRSPTKKDMLLQARIRMMREFVETHFQEKLSLDAIADSASISKSEALRCFRLAIRSTPVRYLLDYRLGRAKDLLVSTDDTVTQIASAVGIENTSYFVRLFSKTFGITPRAFRMQFRDQNGA